ncbi:MAG: ABC transporter substrate-binding protein, partial [Cyanobacteria bacterium P01_E01_bin.48]
MKRRSFVKSGVGLAAGLSLAQGLQLSPSSSSVLAQSAKRLTVVQGGGFPNGLDLHQVGTNRPAYGISWVLYDRLMTFGKKTLPDGSTSYDFTVLEPELAESWTIAEDGMSVTFNLRKDATFHDGKP